MSEFLLSGVLFCGRAFYYLPAKKLRVRRRSSNGAKAREVRLLPMRASQLLLIELAAGVISQTLGRDEIATVRALTEKRHSTVSGR